MSAVVEQTYGALHYAADRGVWVISPTPDVMMRLRKILPGARGVRGGTLQLSHSIETARELDWILQRWPLRMNDEARQVLADGVAEHQRLRQNVLQILAGTRRLEGLAEPSRPARDYQLQAADVALTTGRLLLADDLGLGKTMSGLLTLRDPSRLPALIVCPVHLTQQWVDELAMTFPMLTPHVLRGMQPYNPAEHREMGGNQPDVLISPYSRLRGWGDHLAGAVKTVIFDEMQELRHDGTAKYVAAATIADSAELVMGLTATPVYNYGGEIFNIVDVLERGALGTRGEFHREWCIGGKKIRVADPRALGHHLRDRGLMLRRTRQDVGRELPEITRVTQSVDVDDDVYERLVEGSADLASLILGTDRKAAFQASGELDWKLRRAAGVAKAPYVAEFTKLLLESERKVVMFGWHRDVYDIWLDRLAEFNPVLYTGSESPTQKRESVEQFLQQDGPDPGPFESRVFIMSLRSGAGLNGLQTVASTCVFGELDWSPEMHNQCIGRLSRDGSIAPVVAYFLVSSVGADPLIAEALGVKRGQAEPLRDPQLELVQPAGDGGDRVRRLAQAVLSKRGTDA